MIVTPTTNLADLAPIVPLPTGTLVRYTYRLAGANVEVTGRKGRPINRGYNSGFELVDDAGVRVARISRYAYVEPVR